MDDPELARLRIPRGMRDRVEELDALLDDLTVDAYGDGEQLSGILVAAHEALQPGERACIVGIAVEVLDVNVGPDERTGLIAQVRRDGSIYEVALADLRFDLASDLGRVVAVYRRWQGRVPDPH